ncbi:sarcosine oxidase subunit gamma [Pseudomonas sp. NPDC007930]|uniref:sarcosine oxidase subunit gamma n=1 Tax=Pseudomonas sp. NPDC007930 TaxID=3364417 RepID=UPI0036E3E961
MTRLTAEHFVLDLTARPRVGFRGAQSALYLEGHGFELPGAPNRARRQADGGWALQLSNTEYFLLGAGADDGQRLADLEASWELDHQANYLLPRHDSHAWLQLQGPRIAEVLAKLCGVDLRPQAFAPGQVAQTQVARVTALVANTGSDAAPCFELLFDRCSHEYFLGALLDALGEFGGILAPEQP